jgi:hypothetical protein
MALARIITRSETCSQELALVLVARGYTVEIVSPDKVPTNIADLELRVDTGSGDQLIANVEAHQGEHTSSLDFVHHLKAPVIDFPRRPPVFRQTAHASSEPVSFSTGSGVETPELPAGISRPPHRTVSPALETLPNRELDSEIDLEEGIRLISPEILSPPEEPPAYLAGEDTAMSQLAVIQETIVPLPHAAQRRNLFAGWPWRAALAFAGVVLLATVLGFGARRNTKAVAKGSQISPVQVSPLQLSPVDGISASVGPNPLRAVGAEEAPAGEPGQVSAVSWWPAAADSEADSSHQLKEAQVAEPQGTKSRAKLGTPATSPTSAVSRRRGDDVIARDTTIYFDKRFEPPPKAKRAKPIARPRGYAGEYH